MRVESSIVFIFWLAVKFFPNVFDLAIFTFISLIVITKKSRFFFTHPWVTTTKPLHYEQKKLEQAIQNARFKILEWLYRKYSSTYPFESSGMSSKLTTLSGNKLKPLQEHESTYYTVILYGYILINNTESNVKDVPGKHHWWLNDRFPQSGQCSLIVWHLRLCCYSM